MHSFDTLQHYEDADMVQTVKQCNTIKNLPISKHVLSMLIFDFLLSGGDVSTSAVCSCISSSCLFILSWMERRESL